MPAKRDSRASSRGSSRGSNRSVTDGDKSAMGAHVGALTLLEKRMLEKKSGNFLLDDEIRSIFNQFDRDGNGYLGASDVAKVYRSLGENLDDDLVDELIREADKDGDGQIAYPEFYNMIKQLEEEGGGLRDPNVKVKLVPPRGNSAKKAAQSDSEDDESSSGSY